MCNNFKTVNATAHCFEDQPGIKSFKILKYFLYNFQEGSSSLNWIIKQVQLSYKRQRRESLTIGLCFPQSTQVNIENISNIMWNSANLHFFQSCAFPCRVVTFYVASWRHILVTRKKRHTLATSAIFPHVPKFTFCFW